MSEYRSSDEEYETDRSDDSFDPRRGERKTSATPNASYGGGNDRPRRVLDADFQSASPDDLLGLSSYQDFLAQEDEDDLYLEYDELDDDDFDEDFDALFETLPDDEFDEMIDGEDGDEDDEDELGSDDEICADAAASDDDFDAFDELNADEDEFDESEDGI